MLRTWRVPQSSTLQCRTLKTSRMSLSALWHLCGRGGFNFVISTTHHTIFSSWSTCSIWKRCRISSSTRRTALSWPNCEKKWMRSRMRWRSCTKKLETGGATSERRQAYTISNMKITPPSLFVIDSQAKLLAGVRSTLANHLDFKILVQPEVSTREGFPHT